MNDLLNDPMRLEVFRSVKGGYNKTAVLTKLDALNALIMVAQSGSADKNKILAELDKVEALEMKREKGGFFGKAGFAVENVDAYIEQLEEELRKILSTL